jgi:hypothetical protein
MFRALSILAWFLGVVVLILLGAAVAMFFSANTQWVAVSWPYPRLSFERPFGTFTFETMLGVAAAGWSLAVIVITAALILFPLYLRRTRQYLSLIRRLEHELVALRNLPFRAPAPLEDLPDSPDRASPDHAAAQESSYPLEEEGPPR